MILVDTSVWIELLNGPLASQVAENDLLGFVTTGPIIQEILQGFREDRQRIWFKQRFLALPRLCDPIPFRCFLDAAEIYARGRQHGYTIRSATDCLIAAIAIENDVPVWHSDRDYTAIGKFTTLRQFQRWAEAPR